MNFNIAAYGFFLTVAIYIIIVVGKTCYKNGNVYVMELLHGHQDLCLRINRVLLAGYYLLNIGYAATTLASWEKVITASQFVEFIAVKTALIIAIIAVLHYLNIFILTKYAHKLINY